MRDLALELYGKMYLVHGGHKLAVQAARKAADFAIQHANLSHEILEHLNELENWKYCKQCSTLKAIDDFPNDKARKDGKKSACKACTKETDRYRYKLRVKKSRLTEGH